MSPQQLIAHYRIVAKLGEGGMGAVYRATDTRLNRDVAIKVLPPAFAEDAGRMARFEREAQVLASLNHPNIAAVYGIEQGAIVMELVEGADLAGPLPVQTVFDYARQIAAGLEAAHEKGIVHRDLKPANIRVTPEGVVKILDFGLAKAREEGASSTAAASPTMSPTISLAMTQAGTLLGTAAYMSPEQARGKTVDRRADIWAYGVILFEMLTGRRPFGTGETVTDTLAAIVLEEPDLSALPEDTPPHLRRIVERCLRKDPKVRLRDIGEARVLLDEPGTEATAAPTPAVPPRRWLPWALACAALGIAAAALGLAWMRAGAAGAGPGMVRFSMPLPQGVSWPRYSSATQWVPSPDGRNLAMVVREGADDALWVRPLNAVAAHRLDKTEGGRFPFWSPDGQSIAFFAEDQLKRVPVSGGAVQRVCDVGLSEGFLTAGIGGTWSKDGVIVFAPGRKPLMQVSAAGGIPAPATALEKGETGHSWPQFLPDGHHLLYLAAGDAGHNAIFVQELGSSQRVRVLLSATRAVWSPPGYLLFTREGNLFAQPVNGRTYQLEGEPVALAEDVMANERNGRSTFAVSQNGVLVYRAGQATIGRQLNWRGRDGKVLNAVGKPGDSPYGVVSPDEKSAALAVGSIGRWDVWVMDLTSGVVTPMTRDGSLVGGSDFAWSPDSKMLAVETSDGVREITVTSGQSTLLTKEPIVPQDWSPDGRTILCMSNDRTRLLLLSPADGSKVQTVITTPYRQLRAVFSPDGKYVAYGSTETGGPEIWLASFPGFSVKRRVSPAGGTWAAWSKDGHRLFYVAADGTVMEVEVRTGSGIEIGDSRALFKLASATSRVIVSSDGQRFLTMDPAGAQPPTPEAPQLSLVIHWAAELKRP